MELDKVQNCAARMVSGNYNYGPGTLTTIMSDLNWDSLGDRRRMSRLSMMYKIANGLVAIEADEFLQQPSRFTKRSNEHNFQTIRARTDTYAQSYFLRTIKDWNKLDISVVTSPSIDSSKMELRSKLDCL